MKENFVTQIQGNRKSYFNSFSRIYPTPVQQQAIESFANVIYEPTQIKKIYSGKLKKKTINNKLKYNLIYETDIDFENPKPKEIKRSKDSTLRKDSQQDDPISKPLYRNESGISDLPLKVNINRRGGMISKSLQIRGNGGEIINTSMVHLLKKYDTRHNIEGKYILPTVEKQQREIIPYDDIDPLINQANASKFALRSDIDALIEEFDRKKDQFTNNNYDVQQFEERKQLNLIIQEAMRVKSQGNNPQNASMSKSLKRTQIEKYLSQQYQNSLNTKEDVVELKGNSNSNKILRDVRQQSKDIMRNSFEGYCEKKQNSSFTEQNKLIYQKCYSFLK